MTIAEPTSSMPAMKTMVSVYAETSAVQPGGSRLMNVLNGYRLCYSDGSSRQDRRQPATQDRGQSLLRIESVQVGATIGQFGGHCCWHGGETSDGHKRHTQTHTQKRIM